MKAVTGFAMFRKAIREYCASSCSREVCGGGCAFWSWSERCAQYSRFIARRERVSAARRTAAQAAR